MRTRKQLVREVARNTQRVQKALEDANIKLTGVVSDILGKSGRAILDALVAGETDPEKLVELAKGRLKAPRPTLVEALRGHVRDHHRFVIKLHLAQVDALRQAMRDLEARVEKHLDPFWQERRPAANTRTWAPHTSIGETMQSSPKASSADWRTSASRSPSPRRRRPEFSSTSRSPSPRRRRPGFLIRPPTWRSGAIVPARRPSERGVFPSLPSGSANGR